MKKITFLLTFLISSVCFAQVVLENFEGTAPTLGFSNGPGTATIVTDPAAGAANGNVLEIITGAASAPWQQAELTLQGDWMDLTTNKIVTVDVYSTSAFDMLARIEGGTGPISATDASHTGSGWENLSFDFSIPKDGQQVANGAYPKIFFFNLWDSSANGGSGGWADANGASSVRTSYVDNVSAFSTPPPPTCDDGIQNQGETGIDCGGPNCAACPTPPTVAAPRPPNRPAADVISFFSDVYTDVAVDAFDAGFCGTPSVTDAIIAGNATKLFSSKPCQGIAFDSDANDIDATGFTKLHIDFYTDETNVVGKVFNLKLVDFNGGAGEDNARTIELNINDGTNPGVVAGNGTNWVSLDLNISPFDDLSQIVITSNLNNVWYDNLYLHKDTTASVDDANAAVFTAYPNPTSNNWTISGTTTINSVAIFDIMGKQIATVEANDMDVEINTTNIVAGMYFAKIESDNGVQTIKLIKE
ncbi:T9SS type A sorting domain-containing protein [Nonlabens sp. Ci31]|jgi:endoglucanase|uniref:T9SS type A sorting domain-containing protein n=1 Tax=Nonlabens sp. Ci31 TaxID=2608253 RepID=UPI0014643011|nr:T9SS type A sorting domain-containing protein [Nonlabens sp. Ci31]QJP34594.1 T9SS type A sorting domain-containing protein [Nonlabens sp. Ci31]